MSAATSIRTATYSTAPQEVLPGGVDTFKDSGEQAHHEEITPLRSEFERSRMVAEQTIWRAGEFTPGPNPMEVFRVADRQAFQRLWNAHLSKVVQSQAALSPGGCEPFTHSGACVVCGGISTFRTEFVSNHRDALGAPIPNWREGQICACGLNCRMRSCYHLLTQAFGLNAKAALYCTEQTTRLFRRIRQIFPGAVGSEYLGQGIPLGAMNRNGVRNEDITRLTFADASLDCIFSLDVMEHVPDYKAGFREMGRCLKPGGKLLLTAPFHPTLDKTVVRASVRSDGTLEHHLPPVYHGDPINPKGVLCFNDFGWDMMDDLRAAGFPDATVFVVTTPHFGYVGLLHAILATRLQATPDYAQGSFCFEGSPSLVTKKSAPESKPMLPDSPEELRRLAAALTLEGKWDDAEPFYRKLTTINRDDLEAWRGWIECARNRKHRVLEKLLLTDALRTHPEWRGALVS
jgi:SAM-dependent methyltransferase